MTADPKELNTVTSLARSFLSSSSLLLVLVSLGGCSSTSAAGDPGCNPGTLNGDGGTSTCDAGGSSSPTSPTSGGPLPFKPSNGVNLSDLDLSQAKDEVSLTGNCTIDGEASRIECDSREKVGRIAAKIVTLADQSRVSVFVARSFRIETSTTVRTKGALPIVFAALDDIVVFGTLVVVPGTSGGAAVTRPYTRGAGAGGGTPASVSGLAGGGASFCGIGGRAGSSAPPILEPSSAYGSAELVPLVGGSAGGVSFFDNGSEPKGGGALQLVAGKSIVIGASGAISLPGGGGDRGATQVGGPGQYGAGGGGSGGALLVESPTVRVDGTLAANGGAGGGTGDGAAPGAFGTTEARAAEGGGGQMHGGNGSSSTVMNGGNGSSGTLDGQAGDAPAASGGGGGAGRIRINTSSGHAMITGVVSPAMATPCATEGTFTH